MDATPIVALLALTSGLTALFVSLFWFASHDRLRRDHEATYVALLNERAAHAQTRTAHKACCDDLRRNGVSAAMRRHPASHLRRVK